MNIVLEPLSNYRSALCVLDNNKACLLAAKLHVPPVALPRGATDILGTDGDGTFFFVAGLCACLGPVEARLQICNACNYQPKTSSRRLQQQKLPISDTLALFDPVCGHTLTLHAVTNSCLRSQNEPSFTVKPCANSIVIPSYAVPEDVRRYTAHAVLLVDYR